MPLFLVHRPDRDTWLVSARNSSQLIEYLDATGGSDGCAWDRYNGPICLTMDVAQQLPPELKDVLSRSQASSISVARVTPQWPNSEPDEEPDHQPYDSDLADDIAYVLDLAREDWLQSLDTDGLRNQLRHTLHRLDVCDAGLG